MHLPSIILLLFEVRKGCVMTGYNASADTKKPKGSSNFPLAFAFFKEVARLRITLSAIIITLISLFVNIYALRQAGIIILNIFMCCVKQLMIFKK